MIQNVGDKRQTTAARRRKKHATVDRRCLSDCLTGWVSPLHSLCANVNLDLAWTRDVFSVNANDFYTDCLEGQVKWLGVRRILPCALTPLAISGEAHRDQQG